MLCFGVDGNRNYEYNWLTPDETGNEGGSRVPCTDTFGEFFIFNKFVNNFMQIAGTHPYSEVESQAIEGFLKSHAHRIDAYIALHSYGHLFLHPWGHTRVPAVRN